jgi:hypothetical protein
MTTGGEQGEREEQGRAHEQFCTLTGRGVNVYYLGL